MDTEWLTALATSVIAIGVIFTAWQAKAAARQVLLLSHQIQSDHERGRREVSIDLMRYWIEQRRTTEPASFLSPLIQELSQVQCEKLYSRRPVAVESQFRPILEIFFFSLGLLDHIKLESENSKILLNEFQVGCITRSFSGYLNILETVACAWRHNIADRDIIEEEFHQLFFKEGSWEFKFETYRKVSGVYPSIKEFVEVSAREKNSHEHKVKVA